MSLRTALLAAGLAAAAGAAPALAVPINVAFNFNANGALTANTGNVTTATTITPGAPNTVSTIVAGANNINLVSGQTVVLASPTPVTLGSTFAKTFSTSLGAFTETLTVTAVTPGPTSLGVTATGTITGPAGFDPTPIFYSASYTQNGGPTAQINASFNDSTVPTAVPEPASLALLGAGLLGLAAARRRA